MRLFPAALLAATLLSIAGIACGQQPLSSTLKIRFGEVMPDYLPEHDALGQPWPRSAWREAEKAFYSELLSNGKFEVLVVPAQGQMYGFGRSVRSLISAQLALAIAEHTNAKVADPYLVARALGEGERRYLPQDTYRLAERLGVDRVIWLYVGHDGSQPEMTLSVQHWDRRGMSAPAAGNPVTSRRFPARPFAEDKPPHRVFDEMLPDVLAALGIKSSPDKTKAKGPRQPLRLPDTPLGLVPKSPDPVRDAYSFQLLAALTPWYADRARERFAEKSYLAARDIAPDSSASRLLKARAYMLLGMRPAAIAQLGAPRTDEEKFLRQLLDGNLAAAEAHIGKIPTDVGRLIAQLETNAMAADFGLRARQQSLDAARGWSLPGQVWPMLAVRAALDWDKWSQFENLSVKALLDLEFSIPGFTIEDLMRGSESLGQGTGARSQHQLSVIEHQRRLLRADPAKWCCEKLSPRPTPLDYLDLIEAIGTDNLMRHARFLNRAQASPRSALAFIAEIDSVYRGHPQLALARAEAEARSAQRASAPARSSLTQSARVNSANAMYWEQGQTPTAAEAFQQLSSLPHTDTTAALGNFFSPDIPYRPYYPEWAAGGNPEVILRNALAKLRNTVSDFSPMADLVNRYREQLQQNGKAEELLASLEHRFVGHPSRPGILARHRLANGDSAGAERHYREGIRTQPLTWDNYEELAEMLFADRKTDEAAQLFASYPAFSEPDREHSVRLSNRAYSAGNLFYWTGYFPHARHFYAIAAGLQTGSEGSLSSEIRVHLMDGNLAAAMPIMLQRAQRYNSSYAYRDYLGLLHATGQSEQAWAGFNVLVTLNAQPHAWETATVGQRLSGMPEEAVFEWTKRDAFRSAGHLVMGYTAAHLLRTATMDRLPSEDISQRIAAIERPVWKLASWHDLVVRAVPDGALVPVLGPKSSDGTILPLGVMEGARKTRIKSDLSYYAESLRAIHRSEFAAAHALLRQASLDYDLSTTNLGYLLPYYAYAAARAGKAEDVRGYLESVPADRRKFDYFLARATLGAIAGKHDGALKDLLSGLHRRPYTEHRPILVEYQFGELCEWLYRGTGDSRYRDVALDWARKNQVLQPWFAWPYAIEAVLSTDAEARRKAIAMAHYLDRHSHRLSTISRAEIDRAVREFKGRNPFLLLEAQQPRERT